MSETQFGRDLCATGRHDFEGGPACVRCGEAQVSAMPQRYEPDEHAEGGPCMAASEYGQWVALCDYATLESRLLAAEARVREVEAERDAIADNCTRASSGWIAATADFERLRAERDALVPLARVGLFLRDKLLAGVTNTDLREHLVWCLEEWVVAIDGEDTPCTTQARAILAREET